jgi:hypothetical protein
MARLIKYAYPCFYSSIILCYQTLLVYNIAKPATTPPTTTPTTPGPFATAAAVLCAGAEDVADELLEADDEAEVANELECDALEDIIVELTVAFLKDDTAVV